MNYDQSDLPCNFYNQYLGTNLQTLLEGKCDIYNQNIVPYKKSFQEYSDLTRATGLALDHKGRLLNMSRYITFNDRLNVVLPDTEGISEYKYLQGDTKQCRLDDDAYRIVLKLLAQSKNTVASVRALSNIISSIVKADVFVGDNMDMRYMTYYFLDRIPGWLEVTMHNYDILPRPAGMETKYISAISKFFGFLIDHPEVDLELTAKYVSSFWKTRFPPSTKDAPRNLNTWAQFISITPYILKNVSQSQFTNLMEMINDRRFQDYAQLLDNISTEVQVNSKANRLDKIKSVNYEMYEGDDDFLKPKETYASKFSSIFLKYEDTEAYKEEYDKKLATVHSLAIQAMYDREKRFWNWLPYENYRERYNMDMKNYYLDTKTGWYNFLEPTGSKKDYFDEATYTHLYKNDCGIWRVRDTWGEQRIKGTVELINVTHRNYPSYLYLIFAETPIGKFLMKNIPPNPSPADVDIHRGNYDQELQYFYEQVKKACDNFYQAVELYSWGLRAHRYSFENILKLEYLALGIVDQTRYYESRAGNPSDDDPKEKPEKWRWGILARRLRKFIGRGVSSYSDLFRDSNSDSIIYQYRDYLIHLRKHLRDYKSKMTDLANENERIYNYFRRLRGGSDINNDLYYRIRWMRDNMTEAQYWTDYQKSEDVGARSMGWSQVKKRNYELRDRYQFLEREAAWWRAQAGRNEAAAGECDSLADMSSSSRWGKFSKFRYCYINHDNTGDIKWEDGYDTSQSPVTPNNASSYYTKDTWEIRQQAQIKRDVAARKRRDAANNDKWIRRLREEEKIRTKITESRTLERLIYDYDNMTPTIDWDAKEWRFPVREKDPSNRFYII